MIAVCFFFASLSIFTLGRASPLASRAVEYRNFRGDGSVAQGWPDVSTWSSFDSIWAVNIARSSGACKWQGVDANSESETAAMKAAVLKAAQDTGLDARYIAAVLFKESDGCVRQKTSVSPNAGIRNPGLFQSANGKFTCNDPDNGTPILNPCPTSQINGMVHDGVGITTDWGLRQVVARSEATDVSKYYKGTVLYNSGVLPDSGNLGQGRSNGCYASDIANILLGWVADKSPCNRDTIGATERT